MGNQGSKKSEEIDGKFVYSLIVNNMHTDTILAFDWLQRVMGNIFGSCLLLYSCSQSAA